MEARDETRRQAQDKALRIVDADGERTQTPYHGVALHANDAEVALLGLCLADTELPPRARANVLEQVASRIGTDGAVFASPMLQAIYTSMLSVTGRGLLADVVTTHAEMSRRNIVGYTLHDLYTLLTRAHNDVEMDFHRVEALCQIVLEASARRQFVRLGEHIQQHSAAGTDLQEISEGIGRWMERIHRPAMGADTTIAAVGDAYMQQLADWRAHPGALRGVTSGLANIDKVTHGWRPGKLIVLAARMSVGKTALALFFALAAARDIMHRTDGRHDHQVGIISLEMSNEDLFHRLIAAQAGVDAEEILKGNPALDWDAIEEAGTLLQAMPIRMIDAQGAANRVNGQGGRMTVAHIREHAREWHRQGLLDLLIVDFLTLIAAPKELRRAKNHEEEVAYNIQALKNLAAELNIPVMVLAQLNRENEHAAAAVPQLHHLRDSDVIGQVADLAMFPVRWDYYRERGNSVPDAARKYPKGYTELYLQKHRGGRVGSIALYTDMASNRVWDWSIQRNAPLDAEGHIPLVRNERGEMMLWKPEYWPE